MYQTMPRACHAAVNKTKSLPSCILHSRRRGREIKCKEINMILAGSVLKKLEWGNELAGDRVWGRGT